MNEAAPQSLASFTDNVSPEDGSAPDIVMNPGDTITTTCTYDNQTDAAMDP